MASFSITPVSGFPPAQAESFPEFIQFQTEGTDLGGRDADTLNFVGAGVVTTRGTGENSDVVTVEVEGVVPPPTVFTWREVATDDVFVPEDAGNGIAVTAASGAVELTLSDSDLFDNGAAILVFAEGAAVTVTIAAGTGTQIHQRAEFTLALAGRYAIVTLIKRTPGVWLLCGDMASA